MILHVTDIAWPQLPVNLSVRMLSLDINIDEIAAQMQGEIEQSKTAIQKAVGTLAAATNQRIAQQVNEKLHSRRQAYKDALSFKQVADNLWVIELDAKALWIEEGKPQGSMLDDLLKSPKAKVSADGHKYIVVPFEHSKKPQHQTEEAQNITDVLKTSLKKAGVSFQKLERNPDGSVKQGLLHAGDHGGPKKPHWTNRALDGVRIYQSAIKNPDGSVKTNGKGQQMGRRDVMTFRIASEKHRGTKWEYPGIEGMKFFDEAYIWAMEKWESEVLPALLGTAPR